MKAIKNDDKSSRNQIQRQINALVKNIRMKQVSNMSKSEMYQYLQLISKNQSRHDLPTVEEAQLLNNYFSRFNKDKSKNMKTTRSVRLV